MAGCRYSVVLSVLLLSILCQLVRGVVEGEETKGSKKRTKQMPVVLTLHWESQVNFNFLNTLLFQSRCSSVGIGTCYVVED
jgi:hypothetical protein